MLQLKRSLKYHFDNTEYIWDESKKDIILICDILFSISNPICGLNKILNDTDQIFIFKNEYLLGNGNTHSTITLNLKNNIMILKFITQGLQNIREYFFKTDDIDFYFEKVECSFAISYPRELNLEQISNGN